MSLSLGRKQTRKIQSYLKPKLNKSLKKSKTILENWSQKLESEDNIVLKNILKEAHNVLKSYNEDLVEADKIVNRLEKDENLTEEDIEDALLELELINESIKSYYPKNAKLKERLQMLKGGKHKRKKYQKYIHKKSKKTTRKKK
jgi:hypothetical protein